MSLSLSLRYGCLKGCANYSVNSFAHLPCRRFLCRAGCRFGRPRGRPRPRPRPAHRRLRRAFWASPPSSLSTTTDRDSADCFAVGLCLWQSLLAALLTTHQISKGSAFFAPSPLGSWGNRRQMQGRQQRRRTDIDREKARDKKRRGINYCRKETKAFEAMDARKRGFRKDSRVCVCGAVCVGRACCNSRQMDASSWVCRGCAVNERILN